MFMNLSGNFQRNSSVKGGGGVLSNSPPIQKKRLDYIQGIYKEVLSLFLGFKGLYSDVDRDPLCHVADTDCLTLGDTSLLTPIDRLYSMQDSYFTS